MRRIPERWRDPLGVGLLALALRLTWVVLTSRPPVGLSDPLIYLSAADQISSGHGYRSITGTVTAYYPPGYPYFLGAIEWLAKLVGLGSHLVLIVGLVQALLGAATAAVVVMIARRLALGRSPRLVGVCAGVLVALWPNLVAHSSVMLSETLFIAVFTLSFACLTKSLLGDTNGLRYLFASGVLLGVATLVRPQSALLLIPAVGLAMLLTRPDWKQIATHLAVLFFGLVVIATPWAIRTSLALDGLVAVSTNTGDNLCIGFNPKATGGFGMEAACQTRTSYTDGPVQERERDAELRSRATSWAMEHPSKLPGLSWSKLRITFGGDHDGFRASESYGHDEFLSSTPRSILYGLADGYYFAVLALAIAGAGLTVFGAERRARATRPVGAVRLTVVLVVAFGALVPVLSFGDQRFKVTITPFLAILAALAFGAAFDHFGRGTSDETAPDDADVDGPESIELVL